MGFELLNCLPEFVDKDEFDKASFYKLNSYHWEAPESYRPDTYCKIGIVSDNLCACLKCYEINPKTVFTKRDEPIYKDSCLEFFVAPVNGRKEYINIEMNSIGVFLTEFGEGREGRRLVKDISQLNPIVKPFNGNGFWGVEVTLTKKFLSGLYGITEEDISFSSVKANFYKCGDECSVPHYLAFSPVTTLPPGFHNPDCFAIFKK